jgi:hypothetical protein
MRRDAHGRAISIAIFLVAAPGAPSHWHRIDAVSPPLRRVALA